MIINGPLIAPDHARASTRCCWRSEALIGYLKAGSRASLIAGSISALAALAALGLSVTKSPLGRFRSV